MKIIRILILLLFAVQACTAQEKAMMIDSLLKTMHERDQFSGNLLVVSGGEMIYHESFGFADRTNETLLNENTLFNTGSISKAFTAVAILQLNEKGKIDIDEFVKKYLHKFPYDRITIGHLLTHASGLPAKSTLIEGIGTSNIVGNKEVMKILYDQKPDLQFSPGSNSLFNDVGYIVLAEIVEVVSKQGFKLYLKENIFSPAGMDRTDIFKSVEINNVENVAKGYLFSPFTQKYEEAIKSPDFGDIQSASGSKGDDNIWSTTGDLLRFCQAISTSSILNEESVSTMFLKKTDALMPGQTRSYGNSFSYGWTIPDAPYRIAQARGDMPGFNSQIVWNLTDKRMIIYLSNNYLSFTSYNNLLPYAVGTVVNQGVLNIPKKYASVELTNVVLHISEKEIKDLMDTLKSESETYDFDVPGIEYLVKRLKEMGENEKADLILNLIN